MCAIENIGNNGQGLHFTVDSDVTVSGIAVDPIFDMTMLGLSAGNIIPFTVSRVTYIPPLWLRMVPGAIEVINYIAAVIKDSEFKAAITGKLGGSADILAVCRVAGHLSHSSHF